MDYQNEDEEDSKNGNNESIAADYDEEETQSQNSELASEVAERVEEEVLENLHDDKDDMAIQGEVQDRADYEPNAGPRITGQIQVESNLRQQVHVENFPIIYVGAPVNSKEPHYHSAFQHTQYGAQFMPEGAVPDDNIFAPFDCCLDWEIY